MHLFGVSVGYTQIPKRLLNCLQVYVIADLRSKENEALLGELQAHSGAKWWIAAQRFSWSFSSGLYFLYFSFYQFTLDITEADCTNVPQAMQSSLGDLYNQRELYELAKYIPMFIEV